MHAHVHNYKRTSLLVHEAEALLYGGRGEPEIIQVGEQLQPVRHGTARHGTAHSKDVAQRGSGRGVGGVSSWVGALGHPEARTAVQDKA